MHQIWPQKTKEEKSTYARLWIDANLLSHLISTAKRRAAQKGLEFDLTTDDLEIPEVCPYLKTAFVRGTMFAASLDRIVPELGYVKGNVEVISRKANLMKNNATPAELVEFAYEILERY